MNEKLIISICMKKNSTVMRIHIFKRLRKGISCNGIFVAVISLGTLYLYLICFDVAGLVAEGCLIRLYLFSIFS